MSVSEVETAASLSNGWTRFKRYSQGQVCGSCSSSRFPVCRGETGHLSLSCTATLVIFSVTHKHCLFLSTFLLSLSFLDLSSRNPGAHLSRGLLYLLQVCYSLFLCLRSLLQSLVFHSDYLSIIFHPARLKLFCQLFKHYLQLILYPVMVF